MPLLPSIQNAADVRKLRSGDLPALAAELRQEILRTVAANGGHLASNLGVVELTIALLRVFSPPEDKVVWDVGHQTYAWKLLTGRRGQFHTLRKSGGISGFPKPSESPCDAAVAGHAGTALSTALGMAVARDTLGENGHVVAIVGDGCMTNGISLEALNGLSDLKTRLIVILNDNEMSISQNVGALSRRLGRMLADVRYNRIKRAAESAGHKLRMTFLRGLYHRLEQALKSLWLRNAFFEEFGLRYVGPIDGHDFKALANALQSAAEYDRPVLIHVATQKGKGWKPAELHASKWHGVGSFPLEENSPFPPPGKPGWSDVFGDELVKIAAEDKRVVAITAAMKGGTGLDAFAEKFPGRFHDVGICEEHAAVFAAGLASKGLRPVFAVYSTFLQRAADCLMQDVCLAGLPVLFCIDRAGAVGADGPTHHGMFDIPMLRCLPRLSILQPATPAELRAMMRWALAQENPVAIRYPRGSEEDYIPLKEIDGGAQVVREAQGGDALWIWALGDMVRTALAAAEKIGPRAGVVNARFVKPLDVELLRKHAACGKLATLENGALSGGFGSAVREALGETPCKIRSLGWPDEFIAQGTQKELAHLYGLDADGVAATLADF